MNTSEILDKAADLIEQRGHWKGWYCGPGGQLCARGAMYAAVGVAVPLEPHTPWEGVTAELGTAVYAATVFLDARLPRPTERWNDAKERTKEEVTTALRGAAEAARAEQ